MSVNQVLKANKYLQVGPTITNLKVGTGDMLANVFGWTRPKKGNQQHSNSYVSKRLRHGSIVGSPLCKIDKPRISLHPLTVPWRLTLPNCFNSSFTKQGASNSRVDANNRKTLISSALHAFIYLIGCSEFSLGERSCIIPL